MMNIRTMARRLLGRCRRPTFWLREKFTWPVAHSRWLIKPSADAVVPDVGLVDERSARRPDRIVRREFIQTHVEVEACSILEIGALDSPTYDKAEVDIRYLDYADADQLARNGAPHPRYRRERLVDVDFVCPSTTYAHTIVQPVDLVIANHVIEHIPDTIRWLEQLSAILSETGCVFLSVPDKRYTFDICRQTTTFVDVLRCHRDAMTKPSLYHILESLYFYRPVKADSAWDGSAAALLNERRFSPREALARAEREAAKDYSDVHCHVYTRDSFCELFEELEELGVLALRPRAIDQVVSGSNEFHVLLERVGASRCDGHA